MAPLQLNSPPPLGVLSLLPGLARFLLLFKPKCEWLLLVYSLGYNIIVHEAIKDIYIYMADVWIKYLNIRWRAGCTTTLLTAVVISFQTGCFWLPLIPHKHSFILSSFVLYFILFQLFSAVLCTCVSLSLDAGQADPCVNRAVLFKWRLFPAATFINSCSFVRWIWPGLMNFTWTLV